MTMFTITVPAMMFGQSQFGDVTGDPCAIEPAPRVKRHVEVLNTLDLSVSHIWS
jgi:hypothetical protein